jgi:Recombinase
MKRVEMIREALAGWPSPEYLKQKDDAGWRLVAMEWEREVEVESDLSRLKASTEEIPFGMRVAADCLHLEENPSEMEILRSLAELVVQDLSFPRIAEALNQRGMRTREGSPWSAVAVFRLSPRLIEVAPRILAGEEWETRRKQMPRITWNS